MDFLHVFVIWALVQSIHSVCWATSSSYPSGYGDGSDECAVVGDVSLRREPYESGEIIDITHKFTPRTPVGGSAEGIGQFIKLTMSMKNGSDYNFSELKLPVHAGTHVDAPGHFYDDYYDQGYDIDSLDLRTLNGNLSYHQQLGLSAILCFHNF